jgi:hypothetical protein
MCPGDDPQDPANELRVTDKRRFTSTGEMREESEAAETPQPAEPPRVIAPADAPATAAREAAAPPEQAGRAGAVYEFGIESVFVIFYQSALIALGATHQDGGPPGRVDLPEARQAISFLKILEEKTRGNLTADEAAMLRDLLSEAQMAYVQVARSMAGGGA